MQKTNICKRILSAVLSLVIVLQMLPGGLTLTAFAADSLSKSSSQLALGMNIIPWHLSHDEVFLKNYVKVNGNAMNINKLFTKGETSNVKGADDNGGGIPTGTLKQNKSKFWYAEYIWNINETQKKYMLDENFRLVFEANVIPHYDKHLILDDHWGTAYVRVTDGDWEPGRQDYGHERVRMFLQVSDNENSGEKQPVKNYWDHFWPLQSDGKVTYSAYYYGGMDCANPQVSGSTFYVVDKRNPRSNNSWMSYDIAGNNTLPSDVSLAGGDQKVYYHVSFDEAIRFSDNFREDKDVYVNVDAYYEHESGKVTDSAVKDSEQIKAKLVRIGENTLTFEFTVKQSLKDIYILGIDDSIFLSEHDLVLFDGNGKEFKGPSLTSSTWITDLAGNPLDGGFDSPYAYFDGVAPVLEAITISGKDINANSTKEPTDWTDNSVDRSAVFAGVGDKLTFEAHFSEDIYYNNLVAVLNIRDKNGNPVKLNIKKDYVTGDGKGKIVFKELKIAAGMVEPGTQIRIVSFENADTIKDAAGNYNKQNLSTVSVQTNQKQYLDIDKPKSTTNLTAQNGVYTAIAHEIGNYFTFPLKFNEDVKAPNAKLTSGINDKEFKFSVAAEDGGSYAFEYYIDTKQSINMDSKWKTAATGSKKYTYSKTSDNTQYYLHIKLDPNTNYGYTIVSDSTTGGNGIWFNGTISTEITDWAGNTGTASFKVKHQVDKVKPQATFTGNLSMTADYADAKATFNTDYSLTDNYAIASATYVWYTKIDGADSFTAGTPVVISDIGTGFVTGYNGAAEYIHNFDQSSDTGRKGEVYLEVTVADYAGNSYTTNSETVSFNFVKATGDYQVVTGSETAPLRIPAVTINTPKVPEGNQSENPARTVLFIPDTREGYEGCFWVYDPYNHVSDTTVYDSTEVFAFLDSYKTYYDEFPSGTEEYEKPINTFGKGAFHYIKGTLDQATETGTFTNIYKNMYMPGVLTNTDFDQFDFRYSLSKFIDDTYGTLDFYLVTSTSFPMVAGDGIAADNYNFIQSNSKVEKFTAYIANNADFRIETTDVILDGEECREELDYKSGMKTVPSLDGLVVSFRITNLSDETSNVKYYFRTLDFANSKLELFYKGVDKRANELLKEYEVVNTGGEKQTIVFEEGLCDKTGWYNLRLTTVDALSGKTTQTTIGNFFMQQEYEEATLDSYYNQLINDKFVSGNMESKLVYKQTPESSYLADETVPEIGTATLPGDWVQESYLMFTVPEATNIYNIKAVRSLRVYNSTYNAQYGIDNKDVKWLDVGTNFEKEFYFHPLNEQQAAELENPYALYREEAPFEVELHSLPMVEGINIIVYELENTNGIVVTKEIPVMADATAEEWILNSDIDYVNGNPAKVTFTAKPVQDGMFDINECRFAYLNCNDIDFADEYTFVDDVENETFFLVDRLGNVSQQDITLTNPDGSLMNVDGRAPDIFTTNAPNIFQGEEVGFDDYSNGVEVSSYSDMFHFIVYGWDFDSTIDVKNIKVSFSPEYSARLLGLPADAWKTNEQVVSMKLPVAVDEEGNLIRNADGTYPAWENLGTGNNGIYRTKVLAAEDPDGGYPGYFEVEVWGTWIYSEEVDADGNPISYDMYPESQAVMFEVSDVYGNVGQTSREYGYRNPFYNISAWTPYTEGDYKGFLNIDKSINADGTVGIVHSVPLASIDGYGIKVTNEDAYTAGQTQHMYYTTSPMITDDGEYIIKVIDLFGNEYEIPVYIDGFGEFGIDVVFSETDMTNRDVKVNVFSTGEFDDIVSITASNGTKGTINKQNPLTGEITVSENCAVTIKTKSGAERTVQVANIDKSLDKTDIIYYDQSYNVYTADTKNVSEITAVLSCKTEFVFAINGDSSYTFPEGSKKGDTYTFEVSDNAGNIKNIVATCPCDIPVKTQQPADTTAPELVVTAYAEQEETIKLISSVRNPDLTNSDGTGINDAINSVRAQSVRMAFTVEDTSAVKVFAVPAGSDAPKYSSQQGSTVENVELSVNDVTAIITVKENAEFDLYFVDQAGNTTSYKTIKVGKIDYTAPVLTPRYVIEYDRDGYMTAKAYFWPEDDNFDETIIPLTAGISREFVYTGLTDEYGDPIYKKVYYWIFSDNGSITFNYKDEIGNIGSAVAKVNNLSNAPALVNSVKWYGTSGNITPDKSDDVNRNVTAQLTMSKPISDAVLYRYDENAENNLGSVISADGPVSANVTATTIDVTYTQNTDYKVVVLYTASVTGRKGTYVLDKVECIDKTAPVVTVTGTEMSQDKRSVKVSFTTDEEALLSQSADNGYTTQHSVVLTDNKPVELQFSDKAGNVTVYKVTQNSGVDTQWLTVSFSKNENGTDPTDNAVDLGLKAGDTLYIRLSKPASVSICAVSPADSSPVAVGTVQADVWTAVKLLDAAGLQMLTAVDASTGDEIKVLVAATPKDNVAPLIELESTTVIISEDDSVQQMLNAINGGVTVTDNSDSNVAFTVTGQPETVSAGLYTLTYKATDSAGNSTTESRSLYIMAKGTPMLLINGEAGLPYGKVEIKDSRDITMEMVNMTDESVVVKYGKGMLTTGQMKYFGETVEDMKFSVTEGGHYTIYIRNQERVEYVTYIYVEG